MARTVIAFLEALDLHDVTLVGNDTGGAICQFVLDTTPPIGRVVLTNCDAFENFPPSPFDKLLAIGSTPAGLRRCCPTRTTAFAIRRPASGCSPSRWTPTRRAAG